MTGTDAGTESAVATILVACDFSETSERALDRACELALEHDAELICAHAVDLLPAAIGGPNPVVLPADLGGQLRDAARRKLESVAERVAARGVAVSVETCSGMAGASLIETAERRAADLIVIGTRGLSGFKHLVLGSTAEQVVRRALCPVLTVHPGDCAELAAIRTLIVPSELSEDPSPAIEALLRFFGHPPATSPRVLLVYSDHLPTYLQPLVEDLGIDRIGFDEVSALLAERLAPTAARLEQKGFEVETVIREGEPSSVITELARERDADLIAMETHGRSGLAHLVLGSTAERVVQHAHCPVLSVRHPETQ